MNIGDEVCLIPERNRDSYFREVLEGKKFIITNSIAKEKKWEISSKDSIYWASQEEIILWSDATPAQRAGLIIGDKIKALENSFAVLINHILEFYLDDKSNIPYFIQRSDKNREVTYRLSRKYERIFEDKKVMPIKNIAISAQEEMIKKDQSKSVKWPKSQPKKDHLNIKQCAEVDRLSKLIFRSIAK